jgi:YihY family inner membrane protein
MSLPVSQSAQFARRVLRDFFFQNNGLLLTSAVAYNALLSLIPLSAVLLVLFSHFLDQQLLLNAIANEVSLITPGIAPLITDVLNTFLHSRDLIGWVGFAVLLFFSSVAFRVFENAMAIIFHRPALAGKRKFWVSALLPYLFICLVAAGLIVMTAVTAITNKLAASPSDAWALLGYDLGLQRFTGVILYLTGVAGLAMPFTTLYKVMPATKISFRLALAGGITATILWEVMRYLLTAYFTSVSMVNAVYGSLATTIIVLLLLEAAALIVLLGAQVIADIQESIVAGTRWFEDPHDRHHS